MDNEDADPVGAPPVIDPIARFNAAAVDLGLIEPGDMLGSKLTELCVRVVDMAASIADKYPDPDAPEHTVGDHIRAELFD